MLLMRSSRPMSLLSSTRLIILGLALLTLSGVGWLLPGCPFPPMLVVKLALVGPLWVLGSFFDTVVEARDVVDSHRHVEHHTV